MKGFIGRLAAGLCGLLALLSAAPAVAQTYQFTAYTRAHAFMNFPGPGESHTGYQDVNHLNQPAATTWHSLAGDADVSNGGTAQARFEGSVGSLKAYAWAAHPYCCSANGTWVTQGYSDATAQGSFYDTVAVAGAGLAAGTAVSYSVVFSIDGALSSPAFELGGSLHADGLAQVRLRDLTSPAEVFLNWDAKLNAPGTYVLTLNTVVGHELAISGMLYAQASVSATATTARSAEADFAHSAYYSLAPSVQGLNTLGASGHDFAVSAVPEPNTVALWLLGLGGGVAWRRRAVRRCARPGA